MKRWLTNLLLIFFSAVFVICAWLLLDYYLDSRKQKNAFDDLSAIMHQATVPAPQEAEDEDTPISPDDKTVQASPATVFVTDPETGEQVELLPEFAQLYTMNNDIIGWISIEDTVVDYPVMQTPDSPDYYLHLGFDEQYSSHGCIYAREVCDVFAPSDNITIYGHRMNDGSMFQVLTKYQDAAYWEEHKYIQFNTLKERNTYEIFAVFSIESSEDSPFLYHLFVDAADEAHFDEYIANCRSYALYDTGIVPTFGDKLITLSTCEYSQTNGRLVVVARRVAAANARAFDPNT